MATLGVADPPQRARVTFDTLPFDVKLLIIAVLEKLEWGLYNTAISKYSNIGRLHRTTRSWRAATRERVWKAVAMDHLDGLDYGALHGLLASNGRFVRHVRFYATSGSVKTDQQMWALLSSMTGLRSAGMYKIYRSGSIEPATCALARSASTLTALAFVLYYACFDDFQLLAPILPLMRELADLRIRLGNRIAGTSIEPFFIAAAQLPKLRTLEYEDDQIPSLSASQPFQLPFLHELAVFTAPYKIGADPSAPATVSALLHAASASLERLHIVFPANLPPDSLDFRYLSELDYDLPDVSAISLFRQSPLRHVIVHAYQNDSVWKAGVADAFQQVYDSHNPSYLAQITVVTTEEERVTSDLVAASIVQNGLRTDIKELQRWCATRQIDFACVMSRQFLPYIFG